MIAVKILLISLICSIVFAKNFTYEPRLDFWSGARADGDRFLHTDIQMSPFFNESSTFDVTVKYITDGSVLSFSYYEVYIYGSQPNYTYTEGNIFGPLPWVRVQLKGISDSVIQVVLRVYGFLAEEN